MSDSAQNIRNIKMAALVPQRKPFYRIPPFSKKKLAEMEKALEEKTDAGLDKYFDYHMGKHLPICTNCGMEAPWLKNPQYFILWRACQAHILPKREVHKGGFPSLRCNPDNHIVLFPSWGGWLCGCHTTYDGSWEAASKMNIWPMVVEIFKDKLYPLIPEHEKKNIPDLLIQTL